MYLCVCNAVTEDDFTKALTDGVGHAILVTGAGNCCGQCLDRIDEIEDKYNNTLVAQLEEHGPTKAGVAGSSPAEGANLRKDDGNRYHNS